MAGRKATEGEKAEIKRLYDQGLSLEEIQQRMPDLDGRSLQGIRAQMRGQISPPGTNPLPPMPPPGVSDPAALEVVEDTLPAQDDQPQVAPQLRVVRRAMPAVDPQRVEAERLGFRLESMGGGSTGFIPEYQEYTMVEKLDAPTPGIHGMEHGNFDHKTLYTKYPCGDYRMHHYRNGRVFATYRMQVVKPPGALPATPAIPGVDPNAVRDPALRPEEIMLRATDQARRADSDVRREIREDLAQVHAAEAAAMARKEEAVAKKEEAKAQVEASATVGLLRIAERAAEAKPDTSAPVMDKVLAVMQAEAASARERHKQEMESLEKKQDHDFKMRMEELKGEKERLTDQIKADQAKLERDLTAREKDRTEFLTKMADLDQKREALAREVATKNDQFHRESYDRMMTEVKQMRDSINEELGQRRENADELIKIQRTAANEIVDLKKSINSVSDGVKIAEIIGNGIKGLGDKLDKLIPGQVVQQGPGAPASAAPAPVQTEQDLVASASKEKWFQDLQDEIALTVKRRLEVKTPEEKPHGSMIGVSFVEQMNKDARVKPYAPWLCNRDWKKVLEDVGEGIKKEHREIFSNPEADEWYEQFRSYIARCWNASLPKGGT